MDVPLVPTGTAPTRGRVRGVALAACAAAALVAPLALAGPAQATYPGNDGALYFGAFDPANGFRSSVFSARPDGDGLRRLTPAVAQDICPAVSPDGKQVALCSSRSGVFEIWVMDHNGKDLRQLTDLGGFAIFPDWSPDGRHIVFDWAAGDPGLTDLYVVDTVTGEVRLLHEEVGDVQTGYPVWSPDGTQVLFVRQEIRWHEDGFPEPVDGQLWVLDVASGEATRLTSDDTLKDQTPDWSPDGSQIAYAADDDIWLMDADGTDVVNLTPGDDGRLFGTSFSPRGDRIAFTGTGGPVPDGERYVQTIRTDGTGRQVVAPTPGLRQAVPAWQPLGSR
jgi:TolB protein